MAASFSGNDGLPFPRTALIVPHPGLLKQLFRGLVAQGSFGSISLKYEKLPFALARVVAEQFR